MSLYKSLFICIFCIGLTACGFSPMYANTLKTNVNNMSGASSYAVPFDQIQIANIRDREGQYLRNQLIDTIYMDGYPENPRYLLTITKPSERITRLGIRKDATATRAQMRLDSRMTLTDIQTGQALLKRNLIATNSFNILNSQYTTNVSTDYARQRALDDIGRQAITQLALFFKRPAGETENPDDINENTLSDETLDMLHQQPDIDAF